LNARLQPILSTTKAPANQIQDSVLYIHNSCLSKGATPTKYVAFLDTYLNIYKQQMDKQTTSKKHLDAGLDKLAGAAKTVEVLTKEATIKKDLVARKQKEADNALDVITDRMAKANESRKEADELRGKAAEDEKKQSLKKKNIEAELKDIQPLLDGARQAVGAIQKDNLTEIRALRMPPPAIRNVLCGVLMLMHQDDVTWVAMRNHLSRPTFKEDIIHFDAKQIDKNTRYCLCCFSCALFTHLDFFVFVSCSQKVAEFVKANAESFDPANIMRVNRAAAPLAQWVTANLKYSAVLESIAPLVNELDKATAAVNAARARADQCEKSVVALDTEVKELKVKFSTMNKEATRLKDDLEKTAQTLEVASSLLGKLGGEKKRWDEQSKAVGVSLEALPFNAMLAAGLINFLGGHPEDVRQATLNDWKNYCKIKEFVRSVVSFVVALVSTAQ
jgi:dynein heavy chain 2